MAVIIMLLIVAGSMFTAVMLTRQWAMERSGIDLDHDSLDAKGFDNFTLKQKMILGLLLVPAVILFAIVATYVLAGIAAVSIGGSVGAR